MSKRKGNTARKNKGPWKHRVMEERRKAAEARQAEYNKLDIAAKLRKLDEGGFTASRQRAKLLTQALKANERTVEKQSKSK